MPWWPLPCHEELIDLRTMANSIQILPPDGRNGIGASQTSKKKYMYLAKLKFFTNLDFPEIRGPISLNVSYLLGAGRVFGHYKLDQISINIYIYICFVVRFQPVFRCNCIKPFPNFPLATEQRHKHHCPQSVKHRWDVWDENGNGLDVLAELAQPTNSWQTRLGSPFWGYLTEKPSWERSHIPFLIKPFLSRWFSELPKMGYVNICYIVSWGVYRIN